MQFYDLQARSPQGEVIHFSTFRNKTVLVVNTATRCGLAPQFRELEELHQKYREKGLVILGFPCAQFLHQEPQSNETMEEVCRLDFGVTFQLTEKVKVNGRHAHPVFRYLKHHLKGRRGRRITWNFTKFLVTPDGIPYKRFAPTVKPGEIESEIIKLLKL